MRGFHMTARLLAALLPLALLLCGCAEKRETEAGGARGVAVEAVVYPDGGYRGVYNDGGIEQFGVEFVLKDNRFESVSLHAVNYRDGNYLSSDVTRIQAQVASQYREAAAYLVGKPVSAVADLMDQRLVTSDRDAVTAATLRTGKLISALRDGLRRGVFDPAASGAQVPPENLPDGIYRGAYFEDAKALVSVAFTLLDGRMESVEVTVSDGGRAPGCEALLRGRPLTALPDLYGASDPDLAAAGATGNMVVSALMDAAGRGVFEPVSTTVFPSLGGYENGVYRGFCYAGGVERVSIQFELVNDTFGAVQFRTLVNDDGNCLAEEAPESGKAMATQFRALGEYLAGKEVSRVYDLFSPARIVSDAEGSPAGELPSEQMIAAVMDGLGRGVYRPLEID